MAEEEASSKKKGDKGEKGEKKSGGKKDILLYALMALGVSVLSGGAGVGYAMFTAEKPEDDEAKKVVESAIDPDAELEYIELESLTVNLNVPRLNRYLKATVLLGVPKDIQEEAAKAVEANSANLTNWLRAYLSEQTLDQVSGRKNLVRIQREIAEAFNQELWPDQSPQIRSVLFKEFAVQ